MVLLSVNPVTGAITYTPNPNFNGTDSYIYQVCDNGMPVLCDTAIVYITITAVNDPPVAVVDYDTTPEDTPVTTSVLDNDYDIDGTIDPTSVTITSPPANGLLSVNPVTGAITYTPNPNFNGTDSYIYQVCDNGMPVLCDTAIVYITVTAVNDPPVAVVDYETTPEDTPVTTSVLGNDYDIDGIIDPTSVTISSPASNGTLSINPVTGAITYTPNPNFNGTDSYIYQVCDNGMPVLCDTAIVYITVTAVNDPPVAVVDYDTTPEDTPVTTNVLGNDYDIDGIIDPTSVTITSPPANGMLSVNPVTGAITYTPDPNFNGTDSYIYQVCDNGMPVLCDTAIVYITITPVNDPPVITGTTETTPEDTPITICLPITDPDAGSVFTASICGTATNGTLSVPVVTGSTVCVTYTPNANFNGTDQFCIEVCDNGTPVLCDTAMITVNVTPVNDPPVITGTTETTPEDTPITICLPITDPDAGSVFTASICGNPGNGTLGVPVVTGSTVCVTYTPNANFNGTDQFCIEVCDNGTPVLCDTAMITVNVTPVNDPPVITGTTETTPEDTPITICLPITDPDAGSVFTASICGTATNGTLSVPVVTGSTVCVTYTPNANFNGTDQFCIEVCDNGTPVLCDTAMITVNVTPVNDPPVITGTTETTPEDTPITICLPITDPDAGSVFTASICGTATNGTLSVPVVTGSTVCVTYTPDPNFNGTDQFCIEVCDNGIPVLCDTAMITVNVTPVNDPPVITGITVTTPEDTPITICLPITDPDAGSVFTASICGNPGNGTLGVPVVSGSTVCVTYTPNPFYNGTDQFCIEVCDNGVPVLCDTAIVTIIVQPVSNPPVVTGVITTTPEDTPITICLPITDPDAGSVFTASICGDPANGTISAPVVTGNLVCVTYTPDPDYNGNDVFCIMVCDNGTPALCDTAIITIINSPVNDAPVVFNENVSTCNNSTLTGNILDNGDYDPDFTALSVNTTPVVGPLNGIFAIQTNGDYSYTPAVSFTGTETIVVALCDNGTPLPSICVNDTITINVLPQVTITAGPDITICATTGSVQLTGASAQNASGYLWTSSGTGSFDNPNLLNPVYTPSVADLSAGSVILSLTAYAVAPCIDAVDDMVLGISPQATADAGPDDISCQGQSFTILNATAQNYTSLLWTTSGLGTLQNSNTLTPAYVPLPGETGNIFLTLTATGLASCESAVDQMLLTILPAPFAIAGSDETICENQTYSTSGAIAGYYNSLLWTSSGTGVFADATQLITTYTPSAGDINSGSVTLTLTAYGSSPCGNSGDDLVLTFEKAPVANSGGDASTCQGTPYTVAGASASNYVSLLWTHTGSGTLTGATSLAPVYTPTPNETGVITLTLTATGSQTCGNAISSMNLTIHPTPLAFAGNDDSGCGTIPFVLANASATGANTLLWTSSGTGTFADATLLNAVYTPSLADVNAGSVVLTLLVNGFESCGTATDNLTLLLSIPPSANAGPDRSSCNSSAVTIGDATALGYSSFVWTHNGQGALAGANTLSPTYTPSPGESGQVTLTLNVTAISPCGNISDAMTLTISPAATASAGGDLETCQQTAVEITGATAMQYSSILWTSSGTGTFNDPSMVNPTYTPSLADVNAAEVILIMNVSGISPCSDHVDSLILVIAGVPFANAGNDLTICNGAPFVLESASAGNYSNLLWEFQPPSAGSLSNATTLTPTFTPAPGYTGNVQITLKAYGNPICGVFVVNDYMNLTLIAGVNVNAGIDQNISPGAVTTLNGTVSGGSGAYTWSWEPATLLENNNVSNPVTKPINQETVFTLTVLDNESLCTAQDQVVISVGGINHPPVAIDDYDTIFVNTSVTVNVLSNDYDPDGDPLSVSVCGNPAHGFVQVNPDNTITYTPDDKFVGDDKFCYMICDNGNPALCDTATVFIHIYARIDDLIIHNLLTPNGDNSNDIWIIRGIEDYPDNTVLIFNRWGDKILDLERYDNKNVFWDGTNKKGEILPSGTYYYILTIKDIGTRTGWIFLRGSKD